VFGGEQKRPNLHIQDMADLYVRSLQLPDEAIDGKIFNAGYENHKVCEIADMVRDVVGNQVEIVTTPSDDLRSYHISSQRILDEIGWGPKHSIEDAVRDLLDAFETGKIPDSMQNSRYFNVKRMQEISLK
jgi:nucleoside-diphosphate-sugar epimerase